MMPVVADINNFICWLKILFFSSLFCLLNFSLAAQVFSDEYVTLYVNFPSALKPGDTALVSIRIVKGSIPGFAKFQSEFPSGLNPICPVIENSASTCKNNKLTVVWVSLPESTELGFDYSIITSSQTPETKHVFTASFFYIVNKNVRELKVNTTALFVTSSVVDIDNAQSRYNKVQDSLFKQQDSPISGIKHYTPANNNTLIAIDNSPSSSTDPLVSIDGDTVEEKSYVIDKASSEFPSVDARTSKHNKKIDNPNRQVIRNDVEDVKRNFNISLPINNGIGDSSVFFKVQIASSSSSLSYMQIKRIYQGSLPVSEHIAPDGLHKYSIGSFPTYEKARNLKLECGVSDAFVTAFKAGNSISVVDALKKTIEHKLDGYGETFYAIQIIATTKYLSNRKFARKYGIEKISFVEKDDNMYKYMVGFFPTYQDAYDFKASIPLHEAFVVAYRNGHRLNIKPID